MKLRIIIPILISFSYLYPDTIFVHNESEVPFFAATYYINHNLKRVSLVKYVLPHTRVEFERPKIKFDLGGRRLIFSVRQDDLPPQITQDQYRLLGSQDIAGTRGDNFYVDLVKGHLEAFNRVNWNFWQPIRRKTIDPLVTSVAAITSGALKKLYEKSPYKDETATFRVSTSMPQEEINYRSKRLPKTKKAINKLTNGALKNNQDLVIALCCSGGGERSALATAGFFVGLEKSDLLDTITYIATLSGSTWALSSWVNSGVSASDFKNVIVKQCQKGLVADLSATKMGDYLFKKFAFGRPLALTDIYGAALGHIFLNETDPYSVYLNAQVQKIENGSRPFPIYTGMLTKKPYEWVEFNPYRIGSNYLGGDIPSWAFGRPFLNGTSTDKTSPEPLGYMLGIFGYAIGVSASDVLQMYEKKIKPEFMQKIVLSFAQGDLARQRLLPAQVWNFTYGLRPLPRSTQETLTLIDLGILFNLPLQPLLEKKDRAIDIIIIVDNSSYESNPIGTELKKAQSYFENKNIALPPIDYSSIASKTCSVFKDTHNKNIPVIIYMPMIKNKKYPNFNPQTCIIEGPCSTFNFGYDPYIAKQLIDTMTANVVDCKNIIINEIKERINKKNIGNNRNSSKLSYRKRIKSKYAIT